MLLSHRQTHIAHDIISMLLATCSSLCVTAFKLAWQEKGSRGRLKVKAPAASQASKPHLSGLGWACQRPRLKQATKALMHARAWKWGDWHGWSQG